MHLAPFVATPFKVARQMLILAKLKPEEMLYDLGSGDGRMVIMAAQEFGAKAVGIELRADLANQALKRISELDLETRVKIVHNDVFKVDISSADIVTLYLTTSANEKIKPKLESELRHGTRVVSHDYEVRGWKPYKANSFCENKRLGYPTHSIYLYKR